MEKGTKVVVVAGKYEGMTGVIAHNVRGHRVRRNGRIAKTWNVRFDNPGAVSATWIHPMALRVR